MPSFVWGRRGGGGGVDFTWESFESVLSKITKYFTFCIFIVVQLRFQLEVQLEVQLELQLEVEIQAGGHLFWLKSMKMRTGIYCFMSNVNVNSND